MGNAQAALYKGYKGFWQHFSFCLIATFGDVIIILGLYFLFVLFFINYSWIEDWNEKKLILVVIVGALVAFIIEKLALGKHWSYNDDMPIIPYLEIGLSPLLQLIILPLLIFYLSPVLIRKFWKK